MRLPGYEKKKKGISEPTIASGKIYFHFDKNNEQILYEVTARSRRTTKYACSKSISSESEKIAYGSFKNGESLSIEIISKAIKGAAKNSFLNTTMLFL